ncbi:hypothetical protein FSP39_019969 [Pinctada imbricata]|uniref:Leucine-rich melanocyte differentiation-associated protein n=1 Tax=Pinctada imbricata TaxID=66713 RepID=A0AA88Y2K0_PINIB|nr:hypothetical protein FSP39_019969 [Pinctada imbricata]
MSDENENSAENGQDEIDDFIDPEPSFHDGELSFVGGDLTSIPDELSKFASETRRLDLSFNTLQYLDGLERFSDLKELVLDNNRLDDDVRFPVLKKLETLTLNKNCITNLDKLLDNLQQNLPSLRYLSLLSNVACPNQLSSLDKDEEDYQRYRYFVLYRLPNLRFLDSTPVRPEELADAKRVGPFMRTVRATEDEISNDVEPDKSKETNSSFTPLPPTVRQPDKHIGSFGKSKYVYYGKHSEGNRFIRNNDL